MSLLVLVLTPDNPCNTTITNQETEEVIFHVSTEHDSKRSTTFLKDANGNTLASWEWHDVRSDTVKLGDAEPVPSSAWLHKSIIPFVDTVTFKDDTGRQFKWKGLSGGAQLELYSQDDKKNPIVAFRKSLRFVNRKVNPPVPDFRPATLILDPRGQEIINLALISFLMLEKNRRISETSSASVASSLAIQTDIRKLV
ncbi:hypothetical protein CVT24_010327 [Panaeolus cyanescens]|uniref:DUF6593 domain-containing protein n=1 Tax=Panaeolus cyanescens TaxID=181874 RepID=A0A409VCP0_9AGAR|nr:hypothetical protein CVT24_010327 [Panaeolus cyanescens]